MNPPTASIPTVPVPTALPRTSLHDMLVAGIRDLVERGELRPGEKIPEQQLCARFDVSRTPLREALKVLAAEGMLELRPRRGAVVARVSREEIDELFPIMAVLEALAGELLCARATAADIAGLQALHDRMMAEYQRRDEDAYLVTNRAFHEALFALAGNATLQSFYAQILTRIRACRFVVRKSEENWRVAVEDHRRIMEALTARDARRLAKLLRRHVTGVTSDIARDALEQDATAAAAPAPQSRPASPPAANSAAHPAAHATPPRAPRLAPRPARRGQDSLAG